MGIFPFPIVKHEKCDCAMLPFYFKKSKNRQPLSTFPTAFAKNWNEAALFRKLPELRNSCLALQSQSNAGKLGVMKGYESPHTEQLDLLGTFRESVSQNYFRMSLM